MKVARGHCERCDRCGWQLAQPGADGCRNGDCSQRPLPPYRQTCAGCGAFYLDAEEPGRNYRAERDAAYRERNQVVASLAAMIIKTGGRAWLAEHPPDPEWDPEWKTIVFIDGPTGQLSWHLHDSDVALFDGLPRGPNAWDGHSTAEKYTRVSRLLNDSPAAA